jgi:spore maturation protein CgeD
MKISCILASYNRPTLVRQALKSIEDQTFHDFQLIVVDNSTKMDMTDLLRILAEFQGLLVKTLILRWIPTNEERAGINALGKSVNIGLKHATGDLICYLADDDYYFPTWFEKANKYFEEHPEVQVGFGILKYSSSNEMELQEQGEFRWWDEVINDPMGRLDHNQVIHRRFDPPQLWQEGAGTVMNVDGWFFSQLANNYSFHPINAWAAVKRLHPKNLQGCVSDYQAGKLDDLRE